MTTADQGQVTDNVVPTRQALPGGEFVEVKPIIKALEQHMVDNGLSIRDLSDERHLDMPYSTLSSALRGARPFPSDAETRGKVARLMGVPGLQVAIWCELLTLEDFVVKDNFERDAAKALEAMREDSTVAHFVPSDAVWAQTPEHAKIALILMYQTLTGRRFIEAAQIPETQGAAV